MRTKIRPQTGIWVAQSAKHPMLDFSSGHDLVVCGFEPRVRFCAECGACLGFSLSAPPLLVLTLSLSLSQNRLTLPKKPETKNPNSQKSQETQGHGRTRWTRGEAPWPAQHGPRTPSCPSVSCGTRCTCGSGSERGREVTSWWPCRRETAHHSCLCRGRTEGSRLSPHPARP